MLRSNRPKKVAVRWDSLADENQRERERERERTELATFTHTHKTPGRHLQLVVVGQTTKQHCKTSHTNPVDQLMQACVVSAAHAQALAHLVWPPSTTCRRASGQVARLSHLHHGQATKRLARMQMFPAAILLNVSKSAPKNNGRWHTSSKKGTAHHLQKWHAHFRARNRKPQKLTITKQP